MTKKEKPSVKQFVVMALAVLLVWISIGYLLMLSVCGLMWALGVAY